VKILLALLGLFTMISAASASGLSDSLYFGDAQSQKTHSVRGDGYNTVLTGRVGVVDEKMPCWTSGGKSGSAVSFTLDKQPGKPFTLQVTEVYPPEAPGTRYTYSVYAGGKLVYIRDNPALMFARMSYFITVDDPALMQQKKVTLKLVNTREGSPFRISAIWLYSDFMAYCRDAGFDAPMYLTPLLSNQTEDAKIEEEFKYLRENIHPTQNDIKLGCAKEIYYMHQDNATWRARFDQLLRYATKYDMPIEFAFVSWWGGTPMWIDDGEGGKFSDVKYQQICWSETDNHDDGPELRKLLGDRYDLKYGLTVPNRWSSTPWLTMNSAQLNKARHRMIGERLGVLADLVRDPKSSGYSNHILAIDMENEPRYWDLHCPDEKYPVKRTNLMADFNPCTVADAAKDGVTLDPSDGLDYKERLWLHENVAHYQQGTYDAHERALKKTKLPFINSANDALWHEVYSHAFPNPVFPMEQVTSYHPGLEWNRLQGCRTGIEDMAAPAAAYLGVAREWGRWSQINYEENNGKGAEWHLRALRASYAYGARFYTFYNWQSINSEGYWIKYVQRFCEDKPVNVIWENGDKGASVVTSLSHAFVIDTPFEWPLMNEVDLNVNQPGDYIVTVYDSPDKDRVLGYRRRTVLKAGLARFDLPNSISIDDRKQVYITISRIDGKTFGLLISPDNKPVGSLCCDYSRERAQSLLISWRADAESLISELKGRNAKSLAPAGKLLKSGSYRRAYEAEVKVEKQ